MHSNKAISWLLIVVLIAASGCGNSNVEKQPNDGGSNTDLPKSSTGNATQPASVATNTTETTERNSGDETTPLAGDGVARQLSGDSAIVLYQFGNNKNEKAWTGPSGLAFLADSTRLCVLGDSPFNALISAPDKTRLRCDNPNFDDRFEMTKVSGYEWNTATVARCLVDDNSLQSLVDGVRDDCRRSWHTKGWNACDISSKSSFFAIADTKLGKLRLVQTASKRTILDFDSSQHHPKAGGDATKYGKGSSSTSGDTVRFVFSPDESRIALAVRTRSTPPRAFLAIFSTSSGEQVQTVENFCPTTMLFSPDGRTLATYYGRQSDYRNSQQTPAADQAGGEAENDKYRIRLFSVDDFSKHTDLVPEGRNPAIPVAFSEDGSILIARGQPGGEDSASSSFLCGFDVQSGKMLWEQRLSRTLSSQVYIHDAEKMFAGGFSRNRINNAPGCVYCLNIRTGKPMLVLEDKELWLFAVSPDGRSVVTNSGRNLLKVWEVGAGATSRKGQGSERPSKTGGKLAGANPASKVPVTQEGGNPTPNSPKPQAEDDPLSQLQGHWTAKTLSVRGVPVTDAKFWAVKKSLLVKDKKFSLVLEDGVFEGECQVDATADPKRITFMVQKSTPATPIEKLLGAYQLTGDRLTLGWNIQASNDRSAAYPLGFERKDTFVEWLFVKTPQESVDSESRTPKRGAPDATADAMMRFQGDWMCVSGEENGRPQDEETVKQECRRLTVKGNTLTMQRAGASWTGKFEIEPSSGQFDWIGKGPGDGLVEWIGIYELDGDLLKLCFVFQKDRKAKRPTEFKALPPAEPGLAHAYYTFKRSGAN